MNLSKKIYIVLSQSGSIPSRVLKFFTHDEYNHVSISLTPTLETMYSFGRRYIQFPFPGGFVEEGKDFGTFKKFVNTRAEVYALEIEKEIFNNVKCFIEYFKDNKERFKYNYLGVLLAAFNINWQPQCKFYCSQFVNEILKQFNISNAVELPKAVKPIHFLQLKNKVRVFKGFLKDYKQKNT